MKKTDKKIDNLLRQSLTEVCELALKDLSGFQWITHFVNFNQFPQSLVVICVFKTNNDLSEMLKQQKDAYLLELIKTKLGAVGVQIKNIQSHVRFDTEEACEFEHEGKWQERFKKLS